MFTIRVGTVPAGTVAGTDPVGTVHGITGAGAVTGGEIAGDGTVFMEALIGVGDSDFILHGTGTIPITIINLITTTTTAMLV